MIMRTITLEEHFVSPGFLDGAGRELKEQALRFGGAAKLLEQLCDIGDKRLAEMDAAGIDMQVLSLTSPGAEQLEAADAIALARESNDYLAEAVKRHPVRWSNAEVQMRWLAGLFTIFLMMSSNQAAAEKKVALVIGNSSYAVGYELANARRDAALITSALVKIGFDVISEFDLTRQQTYEALSTFERAAHDADVALFYFSGHGLQVGSTSYLLPITASLNNPDVALNSLDTDIVLKTMKSSGAHVKLLFLDAGLAPMNASDGTIISVAAAPNAVAFEGPRGGNSPYANALALYLQVKGLDVFTMLSEVGLAVMSDTSDRQQPWVSFTPVAARVCLNTPCATNGPVVVAETILATGFSFLSELGGEAPGYGLYSYVAITSSSDRSSAFLKELFSSIHAVSTTGTARGQTNILYLPIKKEFGKANASAVDNVNPLELSARVSQKFYDYKMGRTILAHICNHPADAVRKLCEGDMSRGPYIFTYAKPASRLELVPPPFLFVDLSDVRPKAFAELLAAYQSQVKREDMSDGARINTFRADRSWNYS
jgi:Caspase domain